MSKTNNKNDISIEEKMITIFVENAKLMSKRLEKTSNTIMNMANYITQNDRDVYKDNEDLQKQVTKTLLYTNDLRYQFDEIINGSRVLLQNPEDIFIFND